MRPRDTVLYFPRRLFADDSRRVFLSLFSLAINICFALLMPLLSNQLTFESQSAACSAHSRAQ